MSTRGGAFWSFLVAIGSRSKLPSAPVAARTGLSACRPRRRDSGSHELAPAQPVAWLLRLAAPRPEAASLAVRRAAQAQLVAQLGQCVGAQRSPSGGRREYEARVVGQPPRLRQYLHRPRGQRHAVLTLGLHAIRRHGPDAPLKIDLRPTRKPRLAGSTCRQGDKREQQLRGGTGVRFAQSGSLAGLFSM